MPLVRDFEDKLKLARMSPAMVKKDRGALSMLVGDAVERGSVAHNAVRELPRTKKRRRAQRGLSGKLKVGKDVPPVAAIAAIQSGLEGRWRPLIPTAIHTGLRSSELRGLAWPNARSQGR